MSSPRQAPPSDRPQHPIQVVARRTGLTADTLRAWEKRYGAVTPQRSPTGRRLYTDNDVERLSLLRSAVKGGRRISELCGLDNERLRAMLAEDAASCLAQPIEVVSTGDAREHLQACLRAVHDLDPGTLERLLSRARREMSLPDLLESVITPLLYEVGEDWRRGELKVANEHVASAVVRSLLSHSHHQERAEAPVLVVGTPVGQRHEIGALMVAASAAAEGWNVTYVGIDLPADEIAHAAIRSEARAVALSMIYPSDDSLLPQQLLELRELVGDDLVILVGGRSSVGYDDVFNQIHARRLPDLGAFRTELEALRL